MQKSFTKIIAIASFMLPLAWAGSALASGVTVGNPAVNRAATDIYSNFTIIDTNSPVSANGTLGTFNYYAANTNTFEFVLVDSSNVVQWVSPTIAPTSTGPGTWVAVSPVTVQTGWNLGVHFDSTGTVPFDSIGALAMYTPNGSGTPVVSSTLAFEGSSTRTYSFNALSPVVVATSTPTTTGSISGTVYNDMNKSGIKDVGEPGLQGWTINLYKGTNWNGRGTTGPVASTTSDVNGLYMFGSLADGTYSVEQINIKHSGWKQYTGDYASIAVVGGVAITGKDFGNIAVSTSTPGDDRGGKDGDKGGKDKGDQGNHGQGNQGDQGDRGRGNQGNGGFGQSGYRGR